MTRRQEILLAQLAEEAAEVIQAVAKIQRFGLEDVYEEQTNKQKLFLEVTDFFSVRNLLVGEGILRFHEHEEEALKIAKVEKWLKYSLEDKLVFEKMAKALGAELRANNLGDNLVEEVLSVKGSEGFTPMVGGKEVTPLEQMVESLKAESSTNKTDYFDPRNPGPKELR